MLYQGVCFYVCFFFVFPWEMMDGRINERVSIDCEVCIGVYNEEGEEEEEEGDGDAYGLRYSICIYLFTSPGDYNLQVKTPERDIMIAYIIVSRRIS